MELAKVTAKGQITLPVGIRKKLGVKQGDKVLFLEEGNRIVLINSSLAALVEAQKAFQGVAETIGLSDEQDVVDMVKALRAERGLA